MPTLSHKARIMPASPIRKLASYAQEAKDRGVKVYHLNIGQPDIETPEIARKAVQNIENKIFQYTHSAGLESYRTKLANYYTKISPTIKEEDILATTGGSEAIVFTMLASLNPDDEIIVPEPFYANYNGFATEAGAKIVTVASSIEDDFALPQISEIEKRINERTKAILICNPNNPTGYLYSLEELKQLRDLSVKYDIFFIVDEVYREFCYDGATHHSALTLTGADNNIIVIDSVSKRYSMCGVRLGAIITRNRDIIDACLRMGQARLCPPLLAQIAGEAAIDTPQSYFDDVYNEYVERRNVTFEALNKIEGVYCPNSKGAFYVTVKLPIDDSDKFAQWLLEDFSYHNQTVMVAPATGFYATEGLGKDEIRLAYVLKREDLVSAVKCLEVALTQYRKEFNLL